MLIYKKELYVCHMQIKARKQYVNKILALDLKETPGKVKLRLKNNSD